MLRVKRDQYIYSFSASHQPVAEVDPGDRIVFETYDASTGRVNKAEDMPHYLSVRDLTKVNPAAGPLYVRGAKPGDELVVAIERIDLAKQGWLRAMPGGQVLSEGIEGPTTVMVPCIDGVLHLPGGLRLLARPMVGVIGTAPATGELPTAWPGPQGSNLDVRLITTGAKVHLPVEVEGALFGLGDVHASMGDGEVSGSAIETLAEVTATVDLRPGQAHPRAWIETDNAIVATGSAPVLADAVSIAVDGLTTLIRERLPVSKTEAFMLITARGDVTIGQCCGGLDCTVYASFPKV